MQRRREEGDVAERRAAPQMDEEEEEVMMMMMRERASSAGARRKPPADFGNGGEGVNFSTNKNSVVCLPLVSEGLKLVWTQSDQTRELDSIPSLVRAFNLFPYPSAAEIGALARDAGLPLDKVKVWFMVQRIKYGITWSSEEIEETRLKLRAGVGGGAEEEYEVEEEDEDEEEFAYAGGENGEGLPQFEVGGGDVEDREDDDDDGDGAGSAPLEETGASPFLEQPPKYRDPRRDPAPAFAYFPATAPPAAHDPDPYRRRPPPPEGPAAPRLPPRPHGRYKKTKAQLAALRHSFARHNFPNEAELRRLQEETGLTRIEIRKWFSDSRYQLRINGRGGGLYRGRGARGGTDASFFESFLSRSLEASGFSAQAAMAADAGGRDAGAMEEEGGGGGGGGMAGRGLASDVMGEQYEEEEEEEEEVGVEVEAMAAVVEEEEEEEGEGQQLLFINGKGELETPIACGSPSALVSPAPSPSLYPPKRTSSPAPRPAQPGAPPSSSSSSSSPPPPPLLTPSGRPRKTKAQLDVLKQFFLRCQWPRSEDYSQLVQLTGLPRPDVIQWFGDTRYAVKNGQLRWVKGVSLDLASEILHQQGAGGGGGRRRRHGPGLNGGEGAAQPRPGGGDLRPLEQYLRGTGGLQERDLDALCRRARMSYQQVRDWFACREQGVAEVEVNLSDGEGPADGRK
ncbi:homeobox and leucine zipper encoding a [Lepisosteus oculatus]|uniref:homeobox and leucine zipper encoding a n=1 Tax=Lepisosteus oculatus TaxID=7918 RepID=UPI003721C996